MDMWMHTKARCSASKQMAKLLGRTITRSIIANKAVVFTSIDKVGPKARPAKSFSPHPPTCIRFALFSHALHVEKCHRSLLPSRPPLLMDRKTQRSRRRPPMLDRSSDPDPGRDGLAGVCPRRDVDEAS